MYIGLKNGNIIAFNKSLNDLRLNARIKNITFDTIEETEEDIVTYHNTAIDGIYFKKSECPCIPENISKDIIRSRRRELYTSLSDPITNNISTLRDQIAQEDFSGAEELKSIQEKISELYAERKLIREKIISENKLAD